MSSQTFLTIIAIVTIIAIIIIIVMIMVIIININIVPITSDVRGAISGRDGMDGSLSGVKYSQGEV